MNTIGKKFSASTSHLAKQAIEVASTTFQAANNAITAGLQTCDEKGASKHLNDAEIRVSAGGVVSHHIGRSPKNSSSARPETLDYIIAGGVAFSTSSPHVTNREIWGDYNFHFSFHFDSVPSGTDSSSDKGCLRASAKTLNGNAELPIVCKWKRKVAEKIIDLPEVVGNCYYISADDVGCRITIEVAPADRTGISKGTAFAEIGPFEVSASTRKSLDAALASGSTRFPVTLTSCTAEGNAMVDDNNVVLHVNNQDVKVTKPGPRNVGYTREWSGRYGSEYPKVKIDVVDSTKFELILSVKPCDSLKLSALSRGQRDLIVLTLRCFHARQFVATAAILEHITKRTHLAMNGSLESAECLSDLAAEGECTDLFVLIQRLAMEVNLSLEQQEKFSRERNRAVAEKEALEQDITATIGAYQQLLIKVQNNGSADSSDDLIRNSSSLIARDVTQRATYVADIETQLQEATAQCKKYMNDLELLRRDFRALQSKLKAHDDENSHNSHLTGDTLQKVKMLEQQVASLTKLNIEMSKRRQEEESYTAELLAELQRLRNSAGQTGMTTGTSLYSTLGDLDGKNEELKRLKHELEEAHIDRQSLSSQISALQQDSKELTENFLYVKEKYDALRQGRISADEQVDRRLLEAQRELRRANTRISELENELSQAQTTIDAVLTEKKRLVRKSDSLAKDLNKSKTDLTTSVQRLMQTNQQLLEEKTTAEASLKTVEEAFHKEQQKLSLTMNSDTSISTDIRQSASDTVKLLTQIRERDDTIKQLQSDNETLKSRVRKLATMG